MATDVNIGATFFFIVNKPVTLNLYNSLFGFFSLFINFWDRLPTYNCDTRVIEMNLKIE